MVRKAKDIKILIACEESQTICVKFRREGFQCYSADIVQPSGEHPQWHILGDVIPIIDGDCTFCTMDGVEHVIEGQWDLIIAHPPCTYLSSAGNRWFNVEKYGEKAIKRIEERQKAMEFFMKFVNARCSKIAIQNPVGYINSHYRKPDQIIQPYMFGEAERKQTCLWLKGLPKLKETDRVQPELVELGGKTYSQWHFDSFWEGQKCDRRKVRSKTFNGIAEAIVDQWGRVLKEGEEGEEG